jgi:hypothetical protein
VSSFTIGFDLEDEDLAGIRFRKRLQGGPDIGELRVEP